MRNLFYGCLMCCFYSAVAFCQAVTEKDIAGNWKMAGFELSGVSWDFTTDVLQLTPELEKNIDPANKQTAMNQLKKNLEPYKEGHVSIKPGNVYEQALMGETVTGNYSIVKQGGENYLKVITNTASNTELLKLKISNGKMYIGIPADDGTFTLFYFSRAN